jgi:hypothetical protein
MKLKIVSLCIILLFIISLHGSLAYGKKTITTLEKTTATEVILKQIDKIAVIIDADLYSQVICKFNRYMKEVESRFPVTLTLYKFGNAQGYNMQSCESKTPEDIRNFLQQEYNTNGIKGALLVGQIPFATWEQEVGENIGVSSIFYEDMDGSFEDKDMDGHYDYHNFGSNEGPEIWVCWMRPPSFGQAFYLNKFLDKTHAYYTGSFISNKKAFVACHEDYDNNFYGPIGVVPPLEDIYGSDNVDKNGEGADITVDSEIWNQLENVGYEIYDTWQHASSTYQAWDSGGFTSSSVMKLPGGSLMTFLYGCHSADFWEAPGTTPFNINIAVSYVFGNSISQAATGTSWSYGTEYKYLIYEAMRDNDSYLGEAWFNMESYVETATFVEQRYPDRDPHTECAGNNLIGNPFLYVNYTADDNDNNHRMQDRYDDYFYSKWSDRISVVMPRNKQHINRLFLNFLQNHPYMFPILRPLLQRSGLQ